MTGERKQSVQPIFGERESDPAAPAAWSQLVAIMTRCWRIYMGNINAGTHLNEILLYYPSMGVKILEAEIVLKIDISYLNKPMALRIDVEYSVHESYDTGFLDKGIKVRSWRIKKQRAWSTMSMQVKDLRVTSFNMHGYNCGMRILFELIKTNDIVAVQEHWLYESNIGIIGNVNNDFDIVYASAMDNDKTQNVVW